MNIIQAFWGYLQQIPANLRWQDGLDVSIVAFVLYKVFSFIKETRAIYLIRGLLLLVVIYFLANNFLHLKILTSVLQNAATLVIVAIPVLFQPELRRALSELGRGFNVFSSERLLKGRELFGLIKTLVDTSVALSQEEIGALIVIERKIGLNEYIESGVMIDAEVSQELLHTIFFDGTPLHDGAVILRGTRLVAASVQLPLTDSKQSPAGTYWGMRHRAAIGISEQSDAACLVVSEETGAISLISESKTYRNLSQENLNKLLLELFQMNASPETLSLRTLLKRDQEKQPGFDSEQSQPRPLPIWLTQTAQTITKLFFNLRFIALVVAVIWGVGVGMGRNQSAPPKKPIEPSLGTRLDLKTYHKELLVPIEVQNKQTQLEFQANDHHVHLKLQGKKEFLQTLKAENVQAVIKLDPRAIAGDYILPVFVTLPPNIQLEDVNPKMISVKLSAKPSPKQ